MLPTHDGSIADIYARRRIRVIVGEHQEHEDGDGDDARAFYNHLPINNTGEEQDGNALGRYYASMNHIGMRNVFNTAIAIAEIERN